MNERPSSFSKIIVMSAVISALVASAFGFVAGFIAGNSRVDVALVASLPPVVRQYIKAADDKQDAPPAADAAPAVSEESATIAAVKKTSTAVVSIVITKDAPVLEQYFTNPFGNDDFFQQFFGGQFPQFQVPQYRQKGTEKKQIGAGTGFLVSADGYIVTNRHVVADEDADYTVIMQGGAKFPAKVLARDPSNDIAVIKIEGKNLPFIAMGDSSKLQVGQSVIAIGFALGQFGNTVSTGVVSGLGRSIQAGGGAGGIEDLFDVIQTDAAINPGNSGGPLLDLNGIAIGMNVAIVQGSQNIGFALPISDVKNVVKSVEQQGKIVRPYLGVRYVLVDKELQQANQLPIDYGALIMRGKQPTELAVLPGSPADLAGLAENDIILEADGKRVDESYPLSVAVRGRAAGEKIMLKVLSKGKQKEVAVILAEKK